ncbi:heparinase II/III domain-containing protein [Acholeplasma granularum]|uniref:heparinase II/III domain-containing protein n=1 Tax=Acholeplasma granularum TaxID=264635 RepID=UPI00047150B0|nr:heparinase II/III family protein [Acholeplasma granularum]
MIKISSKILIILNLFIISFLIFGNNLVYGVTEVAPILVIDGQTIELDVADTYILEDKFFGYVSDKENLIWNVIDNDAIYFVEETFKIYALSAGEAVISVKSADNLLSSEFTIVVKKVNLYPQGDFEHFASNSQWTASNQSINDWRLYTGNAPVTENQIVKIDEVMRDGLLTKTVHAEHKEIAYSTIYSHVELPGPGYYYVEFDMKGEDIRNQRVFGRFNVNQPTATQTIGMNGTFDWQSFRSDVVEVTGQTLQVELYGANYIGKTWYDNVAIYRTVKKDYFGYELNTNLINLTVGNTFNVVPSVNPESQIDFVFYYETLNPEIATVDRFGQVTAISNGITKLIVRDKELGIEKSVYVLVGEESPLQAPAIDIVMGEDETKVHEITITGNTNNVVAYKYTNPEFGNYYIKDNNTIVYSPNKNFNSEQLHSLKGTSYDTFKVVLYEENVGYKFVDVSVLVEAKDDPATVVEFWQSTQKNTKLSNGYVQIISKDIETEIPEVKMADLNKDGKLALKSNAYEKITTKLENGTLTGESLNGGTIQILEDGKTLPIQDRYFPALSKLIYGVTYEFTPAVDFFGYDYFNIEITNGTKKTIFKVTVYVAPDAVDFKFDETDFSGVYVLGNDEWLEETRQAYTNNDPYITRWIDEYKDQFAVYNPTGVPANARSGLEHLGVLYQTTKDPKFATMAWNQLNEITKDNTFSGGDGTKRSSWGGASNGFLDAAMVTYSVAFTYNLIYETLDDAQKLQVVRALYEEGFYWFETIQNPNVLLHGNNHNMLINGNLAIAALAVMSYEGEIDVKVDGIEKTINVKEMASEVVSYAYELLQVALVHYSPSGGFPEGPGYSYYAHRNIISLLATLKNIYGGNSFDELYTFGLTNLDGILKYPEYTLYASTPNNDMFYYNEGGASINQPGLLWYARMDEKYIPYTLINKIIFEQGTNSILGLLWYKPGSFDNLDVSKVRPLDALLEVHEFASFRNGFGDNFGIYAALKGFDPTSNLFTHKSLDSGTFELVAYGEKFIENFSHEDYQVSVPPGFWDYDYGRWTYYKKQPQGHNTVIFNPLDNPVLQQDPYEHAPITKFVTEASGGYAILNLSDVYKQNVLTYERGLKLDENRSVVTIQDEFTLRKESEFYWSAHTKANIEIINDKLAALSLNGKKVYVKINSDLGTFEKMSANTPLPGTSARFFNLDNEGINKLIIHGKNITQGQISVSFIPSMNDLDSNSLDKEVTNLNDWTITDTNFENDIQVEDISFDGVTGNQFKYEFIPYQYSYLVKLSQTEQFVPKLNVAYDKDLYEVEIINAKTFGQLSYVHVKDKSTNQTRTYKYRFMVDIFVDGYDTFTRHENVVAQSDSENVNYLIDDDRQTIWRNIDRSEVIFDLGQTKRVSNISMRFTSGIIYTYYFDIYAGDSLDNLEPVYYAGYSTNAIGDEMFSLGEVNARYVKIVFNGNNDNYESAISRVNFYDNNLEYTEEVTVSNNNLWIYISLGSVSLIGISALAVVLITKRKKIK